MSSPQWELEEPQEQYLLPNITGPTRRLGSLLYFLPLWNCKDSSVPLSFACSLTSFKHQTSLLEWPFSFLSLTKSQIRSKGNKLEHRKQKGGMKRDKRRGGPAGWRLSISHPPTIPRKGMAVTFLKEEVAMCFPGNPYTHRTKSHCNKVSTHK